MAQTGTTVFYQNENRYNKQHFLLVLKFYSTNTRISFSIHKQYRQIKIKYKAKLNNQPPPLKILKTCFYHKCIPYLATCLHTFLRFYLVVEHKIPDPALK